MTGLDLTVPERVKSKQDRVSKANSAAMRLWITMMAKMPLWLCNS